MNQDTLTQQQKIAQANAANVSVPDFLLKTFQMLEDNRHSSYVSWSKDGTMIVIKKPLAFAEEVLPIYFKHSNLSSFIRQLNNYSFRKMKSKEYEYCFYHEMFRKDRRDLLKFIKRKKVTRPKGQKKAEKSANNKKQKARSASPEPQEPTPTKKVHTEDNNSLKAFQDNQILYLRRANQQLREELLKRQAQDQSLRHVITVLTNYYGAENIQGVLKMAEAPKDPSPQDQDNNQNDPNKFSQMFQPATPNLNYNQNSYENTVPLQKQMSAQDFVDYSGDLFHNFAHPENAFHFGNPSAEGMETADGYSVSPRMHEDPTNNYKPVMDQPITEINTKNEPDFFREDSAGPNFPFTNLNNSF